MGIQNISDTTAEIKPADILPVRGIQNLVIYSNNNNSIYVQLPPYICNICNSMFSLEFPLSLHIAT